MNKNNMLEIFGKLLIEKVRDYSILKTFNIVDGKVKAPSLIDLYKQIETLRKKDKILIKSIIIEAIDEALHNFFWFVEQNEEIIDLVVLCEEKGTSYKLRDISDGMCGDYASFIDDYSSYKLSDEEKF